MATPIIEKVLGTTNPYATNYIDATIKLTKSFVIHSAREARLFNEYVRYKYGKKVNTYDQKTWRYYKHLAGEYHEVDTPMYVISRDNGERSASFG